MFLKLVKSIVISYILRRLLKSGDGFLTDTKIKNKNLLCISCLNTISCGSDTVVRCPCCTTTNTVPKYEIDNKGYKNDRNTSNIATRNSTRN